MLMVGAIMENRGTWFVRNTRIMKVTEEINGLVEITLKEKDYTTHNFLQWYVSEQIEEEALARKILDKLKHKRFLVRLYKFKIESEIYPVEEIARNVNTNDTGVFWQMGLQ